MRADVVACCIEPGPTAILFTHEPDEAVSFADTIAVVSEGRIAQAGDGHLLRFIVARASVHVIDSMDSITWLGAQGRVLEQHWQKRRR